MKKGREGEGRVWRHIKEVGLNGIKLKEKMLNK